jgi:hypothetical protein
MIVQPRSIAIIASREDIATLKNCIASVLRACKDQPAVVDVLVNGNAALAHQLAKADLASPATCTLRLWSIKQGDKAHAWNEYVHRIWPGTGDAYFLDGYVEVDVNALDALHEALSASANAWGGTGIPTSGRSAAHLREVMLREGGFHGNLNVLRAHVMQKLKDSGFRLPLGLYRTDSLTGALLMFGLDPAAQQWDKQRIVVVPGAVWKVRGLGRLSYKNLVSHVKRILRQAQGELENRAVREHLAVRRLAPNLLAPTSQALVNGWIAEQPEQARRLFRKRPLCAYAAWRLRAPRDWSAATVAPVMVANIGHPEDPPSQLYRNKVINI